MAATYSLSLKNADEIKARFEQAPMKMTANIHTAIQRSVSLLESNIKKSAANAHFKHSTGSLLQSIKGSMIGTAKGKVVAGVKYAAFVELGTKPHVITAKNARVLARKTGGTGSNPTYEVFGKTVHHPGTAPNPFFKRGIEESESGVNEAFIRAVQESFK